MKNTYVMEESILAFQVGDGSPQLVKLVGTASVKYLHTAESLVRSMLLNSQLLNIFLDPHLEIRL